MRPPNSPPIIHGIASAGLGECERPQVQAEAATTQRRRRPVLFTVPCTVMASPTATWPWKAFSFRAGFEVRNGLAMVCSSGLQLQLYSSRKIGSNRWHERDVRELVALTGIEPVFRPSKSLVIHANCCL